MQKSILSPGFFIGKKEGSLISFGSGQPDLPPPEFIYTNLEKEAENNFQYGLIQGEKPLRDALSKLYADEGADISADNIIITNGASEAIDLILRFLSRRNKTILVPRPYYYSYPLLVRYAGLKPIYYDLVDGHIDLGGFKALAKTADIALVNSPSNPAGSVEDPEVLKQIEQLSEKEGLYVLSDEVYRDLIYEKEYYRMKGERIITINSFSKTYGMCGFRVGYAFSPDELFISKLVEMKNHTSMNTNLSSQTMALNAVQLPDATDYLERIKTIWKERRDTIYNEMLSMGLDLWKPEGAFYVLPKFKNPLKVITELYYKHQIIAYNGDWFGCGDRVRFSYALETEKIKEGLDRLKRYLQHEGKDAL